MGPRLRRLLVILAGAHLGLVALHVFGEDFQGGREKSAIAEHAKQAIAEYAALSGAESQYTFFAPGVDEQLRLVFEVADGPGAASTDVLEKPANAEVDLRVANLISLLWWRDQELERALEASWAGVVFARHPGAERIVIDVELYELPSMAEYRAGQRPSWHSVARSTFSPPAASEAGG